MCDVNGCDSNSVYLLVIGLLLFFVIIIAVFYSFVGMCRDSKDYKKMQKKVDVINEKIISDYFDN